MSENNHFDVIIIGTGAGGGTLAYALAPSGKNILLLERGGYLPRPGADGRVISPTVWWGKWPQCALKLIYKTETD